MSFNNNSTPYDNNNANNSFSAISSYVSASACPPLSSSSSSYPYDAFHVSSGAVPINTLSSLASSAAFTPYPSLSLELPSSNNSSFELFPNREVYRSLAAEPVHVSADHSNQIWNSATLMNNSNNNFQQNSLNMKDQYNSSYNSYNDDLSMPSLGKSNHKDLYLNNSFAQNSNNIYATVEATIASPSEECSAVPPCLSLFGGYLEPCSHFYTSIACLSLLPILISSLQSAAVDCSVNQDKFKINCVAYKNGFELTFVVRIFSAGANATSNIDDKKVIRLAVEFQRRGGDCAQFYDIFRSAKAAVVGNTAAATAAAAPVDGGNSACPPMSSRSLPGTPSASPLRRACMEAPSLRESGVCSATLEQKREAIRMLINMWKSDCFDIKHSAIHALVEFTTCSEPSTLHALEEEGAVQLFIDALGCCYEQNHRAALTGLANLTKRALPVCEKVIGNGLAMKCYYKLANSATNQVVRETARCLANIGEQLGTNKMCNEFKSCLQNLAASQDNKAREHVLLLIQTMEEEKQKKH